jgi:Tfp pilus assembly protein PilO
MLSINLKHQLVWCRRAQWALAVGLFVACVGFYVTGIRPPSLRLGMIQTRVDARRAQLELARERTNNLVAVQAETERLRERVERFEKHVPAEQDLPQLIADVTRFGQESSLSNLQWRSEAAPRRTPQYTELPIQFTFAGDFRGVFDFLRKTEAMQRLTRVKKLQIKSRPSDAAAGATTVDGQLTMNIYFTEE